ncbi:MAG: DUF1700 domain-containing protein [Oscillospiraceae bacterium]
MNKNEYLYQLRNHLKRLPPDEISNAISFYEEFFEDAGKENEQSVIEKLGSPKEAALKIICEYGEKNLNPAPDNFDNINQPSQKKNKGSIKTAWIVIASILATPIALPLGIAGVIIVLALLISLFAVLFSFLLSGIAIVLSGILGIVVSIISIPNSFSLSLFYIGICLMLIAIGVAITLGIVWLYQTIIKALSKFMTKRVMKGTNTNEK